MLAAAEAVEGGRADIDVSGRRGRRCPDVRTPLTLSFAAAFTAPSSDALLDVECATICRASPPGTTRASGRPVVASLTRESSSLSVVPATSAPMTAPPESRTGAYEARYWSLRSLFTQTSEPE